MSGYWQCHITQGAKEKTAFITFGGLFSSSHDLRDCRSLFTALLIEEIDFEE